MQTTLKKSKENSWLEIRILENINLNWEIILFSFLILMAVITRFYDLGARVMSHDESLHTYFSWLLYQGRGFEHTPLMHGPLQFHLLALSYYIFGDSDLSARIPVALASIASIAILWQYRRYLGKLGALIAGFLFLISPYMLYYGRYVRNEALVVLLGMISIWAVLRFLETGKYSYLYYLSAASALHFTAKETSFIYTAQILLFLGFLFLYQVYKRKWLSSSNKNIFFIVLIISAVFLAIAAYTLVVGDIQTLLNPAEISAPVIPDDILESEGSSFPISPTALGLFGLGGLLFVISLFLLTTGFGLNNLKKMRSFGLILLQVTMVIPHLSALPIRLAGSDPLDYSSVDSLLKISIFLLPMIGISIGIGIWWNSREWLINSAIFYVIFILFYTTLFTNGPGFFSGLVGSLGYWLEQQGVKRGSQPTYYYYLIQLPIYEFLAYAGTLLASALGIQKWLASRANSEKDKIEEEDVEEMEEVDFQETEDISPAQIKTIALLLFGFWAITSLSAYTFAGEKMPWLTVHIALPMLLLSGWALGEIAKWVDWRSLIKGRGWLSLVWLPILFVSLAEVISISLNGLQPSEGQTLEQLEVINGLILAILGLLASIWGLVVLVKSWSSKQVVSVFTLAVFGWMAILTTRASLRAAYINYDRATEYLVYAHSARGVKDVMERVEDISLRMTDGLAIEVAFDDDVSWPFTWYLRNYTNQKYYGRTPTRELRNAPVIIVGDNNFSQIEPIVAQGYYRFDYIRMWWPNQDYFDLNLEKIRSYIETPGLRSGILDIWLNRDYDIYGEAVGQDLSLPNWNPSDRMRMYIRKDVVAQLWDYGVGPSAEAVIVDPYEGKQVSIEPDMVIATDQDGNNIFNAPRGIAVSPDGSIYVTDSKNNRVVHLLNGEVINQWGSPSIVDSSGQAAEGTFNEPWGIAVSPSGEFVYVADTWNHRIQKFSASGAFISMWGVFDQSEDPNSFWGPRDIAVDSEGNIFISNTGNKRIVVFDENGGFITQFGGVGFGLGQFDEPVGIGVNLESGLIYIADTWNQRMQVFQPNELGGYDPVNSWDIIGWYGQSLENKPFVAVGNQGNVYVSDPELSRVLVFSPDGNILNYFGDFGSSENTMGLVIGIAEDNQGGLWVIDGEGNRALHYTFSE